MGRIPRQPEPASGARGHRDHRARQPRPQHHRPRQPRAAGGALVALAAPAAHPRAVRHGRGAGRKAMLPGEGDALASLCGSGSGRRGPSCATAPMAAAGGRAPCQAAVGRLLPQHPAARRAGRARAAAARFERADAFLLHERARASLPRASSRRSTPRWRLGPGRLARVLHHHVVEYPKPDSTLSVRIGTALINGHGVARALAPSRRPHRGDARAPPCRLGRSGTARSGSSRPSPVMNEPDHRPSRVHILRLQVAEDGLRLLASQPLAIPPVRPEPET